MTSIVDKFGVVSETPVLSSPVLLEAYGEVGSFGCAPQCHRTIFQGLDKMRIPHYFPGAPVLCVVGFVLTHVFFVYIGLTELWNGVVVQRLPLAEYLIADGHRHTHHAPVGNTIDPDVLCRFRQRCEENL